MTPKVLFGIFTLSVGRNSRGINGTNYPRNTASYLGWGETKEMNAIAIANLRKSFDGQTNALNNISLCVPRGEIFGFLGPNEDR